MLMQTYTVQTDNSGLRDFIIALYFRTPFSLLCTKILIWQSRESSNLLINKILVFSERGPELDPSHEQESERPLGGGPVHGQSHRPLPAHRRQTQIR